MTGPPVRRPCGTPAALRRHLRRGEKPCQACLQAGRRRGNWQSGALSPDRREIRNGLPWKPYVYRGTGADQYEHLYTGRYARLRDDEEEACA